MSRVYRACRYRADGTQFHYETKTERGGGSPSGYLFTMQAVYERVHCGFFSYRI